MASLPAPFPRVLLDANVLYAVPVADICLALAAIGLLEIHWSPRIQDEWTRTLSARRPDLAPAIQRRRAQLDHLFPSAAVEPDPRLSASLTLPDTDDRHVLAAAIVARASIIVTSNLGDFPPTTLRQHGISAQNPDGFLLHLLAANEPAAVAAISTLRRALDSPALDVATYLAILQRSALRRLAKALAHHRQQL